jgi:hypothetical protein
MMQIQRTLNYIKIAHRHYRHHHSAFVLVHSDRAEYTCPGWNAKISKACRMIDRRFQRPNQRVESDFVLVKFGLETNPCTSLCQAYDSARHSERP